MRPGPEEENGEVSPTDFAGQWDRQEDGAFSGPRHQPTGEGTQTLMSLPPSPGEIDDTEQVHCGPCVHGITVQAERQTTKQTGCSTREGN